MSYNEDPPRSRFQVRAVELGLEETRIRTEVRWRIHQDGTVVTDVNVPRKAGVKLADLDVSPVTQAIARHYGVDVEAVVYKRWPTDSRQRLLPSRAIVWVPRTCEHVLEDAACDLARCEGTPGMDTALDSGKVLLDLDLDTVTGTGGITEVREVISRVERDTGATVVAGFVGESGWFERRERKVFGYGFVADGTPVRVLSFEARETRASAPAMFTVVYAGHAGGVMLLRERYARRGAVVAAIVEHLDRLADERTMDGHDGGWVWLKHPPLGWQVLTEQHGIVEITEASTNDGFTLRVTDADGVFRYVDRPGPKRWFCSPAGVPAPEGEPDDGAVAQRAVTEVGGVPVETISRVTAEQAAEQAAEATEAATEADTRDVGEAGVTHVEAGGTAVTVTARVDISADTDADMVFDDVAGWASVPGVLGA